MTIKYSIVVPLKDEEGNIGPLVQEVEEVMSQVGAPWEMVCIDDGSTDNTLSILQEMKKNKPFLRTLVFSKNFGQSSAFDAGFRNAQGEFVITMDGDRQNDPADIPKLIELATNSDLVCGIRKKRKDNLVKRFVSYIANNIRSRVCKDGIQDTGCSLKLYRRDCFNKIKLFNGMHRFLPALFQIEGFRVKEVLVNHRERTSGTTKYNFFNRSFNTVADMLAVRWMRKRHLNYQIKK
jgi:dolichol-phosphate mannosyltransferase